MKNSLSPEPTLRSQAKPHLTRGNVLNDLGFTPSESLEIKVKAEIYRDLLQHIRECGLTQQELAAILGIHQPDVSQLLSGKVSKFSVSKLIRFAGKLNLGAQIKLIKPRQTKPPAISASPTRRSRSSSLPRRTLGPRGIGSSST